MKLQARSIVSAVEGYSVWPLLPAMAVMLIVVFTWSLAQAAPGERAKDPALRIQAIAATGNIAAKAFRTDRTSEREAALFFSPEPVSGQTGPRVYIRETN